MIQSLSSHQKLFVKQVFELAEIFNFESRNKYRICDEGGRDIGYAAEQQKGILGFLFRQFLGHWRTFDIHFFDSSRQLFLIAHHPFRWYFQRLDITDVNGRRIGFVERRFSFLTKRFDVCDARGHLLMEIASPFWRIWTFPFKNRGTERARVSKKWSGIGFEMFTDKDNFLVEYLDPSLNPEDRALVLAASIYIDLMFFEEKANSD